jgi:hypothetical protein
MASSIIFPGITPTGNRIQKWIVLFHLCAEDRPSLPLIFFLELLLPVVLSGPAAAKTQYHP